MKKNKLSVMAISLLSLMMMACNGGGNNTANPSDKPTTGDITSSENQGTSGDSSSHYSEISEDEMTGGIVMTLDETKSYYIVTDYISVEYDIVIPDVYQGLPVREIGEAAFRYKTIDTLTLPHSLRKIGKEAFLGLNADSKLTEINLPEGVEEIDDGAFTYCPTLTSVTLPASLKTIGQGIFHLCFNIKKVKVAKGSTAFLAENNVLYSADKKTLYFYPAGLAFTSFDLPQEVEHIADYAFYGNSVLTAIGIPTGSNLTSIGYRSLAAISSLTTLRLEKATKLTEVGERALSENSSLIKVTLPESLTTLSTGLLYKDSSLQTVTINGAYTEIPEEFLSECPKLQTFTIASGVTSIGKKAFNSCGTLTKITIPSTVTSIGEGAFYACFSLKNVTLPSTITEIPNDLFRNCRSLTTINIPDGITAIGSHAFDGCQALSTLDLSATKVTTLEEGTFMSCEGMTEIKLPENLTVIGKSAFKFCYELRRVQIPSKVTSILEDAFFNCSKLAYVYIPKSVKSIGSVALRTTYANPGTVNLYFEADSFVNENTEVGDNYTNGVKHFSKTVADYESDSQGALL